jgi:adenylyltransferase/sulfurtransferase
MIREIFNNTSYLDAYCTTQDSSLLISSIDLKERINDEQLKIVSVFNNTDLALPFKVHQKLPFNTFNISDFIPDFKKDYVIVCSKGITSYEVTKKIKEKFPQLNVYSLVDGIEKY